MSSSHSDKFKQISEILVQWYENNKRDLPWRKTNDPYLIWLSEIILQQTRVSQGFDYYTRFAAQFPTVLHFAAASEDHVLKLWQGLGYYSRARNMHYTAKRISSEFGGQFPSDYRTILSLKGVGEYTAAAIASFAFDLPYATVDGNVYRVLSRLFAIAEPIDSGNGKKLFAELANELLDKNNPGLHNQAMMEFGALQCVPSSPNCGECVLSDSCLAYADGSVSSFPVKQGKTVVKERFFNYFDVRHGASSFLHKRIANDVWKNLYEFPLIETDKEILRENVLENETFRKMFDDAGVVLLKHKMKQKHVLSHRIIYANFFEVVIQNDSYFEAHYLKLKREDLDKYAVSRLVHKYLEQRSD